MKSASNRFYSKGDRKIRKLVKKLCGIWTSTKSRIEFQIEFVNAFSGFKTAAMNLYAALAVLLSCFEKEEWLQNRVKPLILVRDIMNKYSPILLAEIFVHFRIYEMHYGNHDEGVSTFIISSLQFYSTTNSKATYELFLNQAEKYFDKAADDYSDRNKKMTIMFCGGKSVNPNESTKEKVFRVIADEKKSLRNALADYL